jgi:hypothetical protein
MPGRREDPHVDADLGDPEVAAGEAQADLVVRARRFDQGCRDS